MPGRIILATGLLLLAATGILPAQSWEIGGAGGFGFMNTLTASNPLGTANTGFESGGAFGGVITQHINRIVSGDIRYTYRQSDLKVSGNTGSAVFGGNAHVLHYDLVFSTPNRRATLQPFVAVGGGMKLFRGSGKEQAYQPGSEYVLLTATQEVKPLISFGGGVRVRISERVYLRMEMRDYLTPYPKGILAPAPNVTVSGWLHDLVPLVGLSFAF